MGSDPFELSRFVDAQRGIFETALAELRRGRKQSHWMWFIFPQFLGLGSSPMAIRYAIGSLDEARAYLAHALLGPRLREATLAILGQPDPDAEAVLGPVDALKLRSSMTLFEAAADNPSPFAVCLAHFYAGERDPATLRLIGR